MSGRYGLISKHSIQNIFSWHKITDFNLVLKSKWLHPTLSMQRDQILLLKNFSLPENRLAPVVEITSTIVRNFVPKILSFLEKYLTDMHKCLAVAILLPTAIYPQRLFCRELFVIGQS